MINITVKAKEKLLQERQKEGLSEAHNLRISVEKGGCSGLTYHLIFDMSIQPTDEVLKDKDIKILVDKKSLLYLSGTTLDFSDGLKGKGFFFTNPNATKTCNCGESFSI